MHFAFYGISREFSLESFVVVGYFNTDKYHNLSKIATLLNQLTTKMAVCIKAWSQETVVMVVFMMYESYLKDVA